MHDLTQFKTNSANELGHHLVGLFHTTIHTWWIVFSGCSGVKMPLLPTIPRVARWSSVYRLPSFDALGKIYLWIWGWVAVYCKRITQKKLRCLIRRVNIHHHSPVWVWHFWGLSRIQAVIQSWITSLAFSHFSTSSWVVQNVVVPFSLSILYAFWLFTSVQPIQVQICRPLHALRPRTNHWCVIARPDGICTIRDIGFFV